MNIQARAALSDLALERTVLGALIAHPDAWGRVGATLQPDHFSDQAASGLFKIISRIANRDGRVSALAVRAALEVDEDGSSVWRDGAILKLMDAAPIDPAEVDGLASALVEVYARRRNMQVANWIENESKRAYTSPFDLARDATQWLEEIIATGRSARATQEALGDAAEHCLDDLANPADPSITTGLVDLDRYLGGYAPGRLIVLAGRPGMGKSTVAPSSARQTALAGGGVYYVSLEMTRKELSARLLTDAAWSRDTPIPYERVLKKKLEQHETARLRSVLPSVKALPFIIDDQSGLTVEELQGRARRHAQDMARKGGRLSLVVVDYLQLLKPDDRYSGNATREIGEIARRLKIMAKELDVCVLALCQLNRGVEGREDKRPTKADLRQSGEIEENADQVILLYREAYYLARQHDNDPEQEAIRIKRLQAVMNDLEILVDKNRHGQEGAVKVWADMGACAIRNGSYGGWR